MSAGKAIETILLTEAVMQNYSAAGVDLHCLARGEKSVYKITRTDGPDWILRAYRVPDAEADAAAPQRLAVLLQFLQNATYPTERVINAADGSQVTASGGYYLLMTSCLGRSLTSWHPAAADAASAPEFDYFPKTMQAFGEALGLLHSLQLSGARLPVAGMLPRTELAWAADCLRQCTEQVPRKYQENHHFLTSEVERLDPCENLPHCLIHNDCNFGNAVQTPAGQVMLVDWDGAGIGPAVLDIGFVLSSCFDKQQGHLQAEALEAFAGGYCRQCQLTDAELEHLPDAVRFRPLVLLACCFSNRVAGTQRKDALIYGAPYAAWQAQYHASDQIAGLAQKHFRSKASGCRRR